MDKNSNRGQIILRYAIVSLLISVLAAAVVYRAVDTTVIHAKDWNHKADSLMSRVYYVQPKRGDILADDGTVLATTVTAYDISMDYHCSAKQQYIFAECLDSICDSLALYYPKRTKEQWRAYLASPCSIAPDKRPTSHIILRGAADADYQRLLSFPYFNRWPKNRYKHGLRSDPREVRMMPYGAMAHRSIGRCDRKAKPRFVGADVNKDYVEKLHGYSGLESALDTLLAGKTGQARLISLTHGVSNWVEKPAEDGLTLRTTININMQDIVENELQAVLQETQADWGTCILMHVPTGDIKAISNLDRDKATGRYIEAMNYALRRVEPGSVMKPISMIIALEDGYALPLSKEYSIGSSYTYAGGSPIHDTHSPGSLPVSRFIEYSSNIGMTKLLAPHYAKDINGFRKRLGDIGFLDTLHTGMAGEVPPKFPTLDPKAGGHVSLSRMTYGYASQIPPLYTCAIYNAIANKGRFVRPRMVTEHITSNGVSIPVEISYVRDSVCSQLNARRIMEMLHSVVYGEGGTAKSLRNDKVTIVGKTGTCHIANEAWRDADGKLHPAAPGYKPGQLRLAFCGIFPYEDPQYTCMVLISNPSPQFRGAATTSGKVVQNIAYRLYSHGMLGNYSDYKAVSNPGTAPLVYASDKQDAAQKVKQAAGAEKVRICKTPAASQSGIVPDVTGLGIRDAIARIEGAGYTIEASGIGYAHAQTPAPGTQASPGQRIKVAFTTR